MKILDQKDFSQWRFTCTCDKCETKLEAESKDVKATYHDGYYDPRDCGAEASYWTYSVKCPVCSNVLGVPSNQIAKGLAFEIQKSRG